MAHVEPQMIFLMGIRLKGEEEQFMSPMESTEGLTEIKEEKETHWSLFSAPLQEIWAINQVLCRMYCRMSVHNLQYVIPPRHKGFWSSNHQTHLDTYTVCKQSKYHARYYFVLFSAQIFCVQLFLTCRLVITFVRVRIKSLRLKT